MRWTYLQMCMAPPSSRLEEDVTYNPNSGIRQDEQFVRPLFTIYIPGGKT